MLGCVPDTGQVLYVCEINKRMNVTGPSRQSSHLWGGDLVVPPELLGAPGETSHPPDFFPNILGL